MKLLVVGASGYLGSEILGQASTQGYDAKGTYANLSEPGLIRLDCADSSTADEAYAFEPSHVIWSMSSSNPPSLDSLKQTVEGFVEAKHIYISSDVTTCQRTVEHDGPLGDYARQKLQEQELFASIDGSLILTPGPIYGVNSMGANDSRTDKIVTSPYKTHELWADVFKTFTPVKGLAKVIIGNYSRNGKFFTGPPKKPVTIAFLLNAYMVWVWGI